MATVISSDSLESHSVNKYNFKVIALGTNQENEQEVQERRTYTQDNHPKARTTDSNSNKMSLSSKETLIESLMQKTDEMSSNFIKLQMKLESKEEEFEALLEKEKEKAFSEGLEAGIAKALTDANTKEISSIEQFSSSVVKLDNSAKEFELALEGIKKELMSAALDISKEVVKVELSQSSNEIAQTLSNELLTQLQGASKITLKVNPKNLGSVSQNIEKLEFVTVVSDNAISEGGVIVMSDSGNIDSQISKRFEKVKKAALSE